MTEFFKSIGSIFDFLIKQLSMIGEFFTLAIRAFVYVTSAVAALPMYLKVVIMQFIAVSVLLMILNRGT